MKRAIKLALQVVAALFGSLAIVFAVLAWRLSAGPISLGFLSPYIEEAFVSEDLSYRVEFSDTILTWAGFERTLDIVARDVKVRDEQGAVVGSVPELSFGLSGLQLLRGRVSPTVIEVLRPQVFLHRARDGTISFGFGEAKASGPSDPVFANLLEGVTSPRDPRKPLGLLREVSVVDADITLEDESLGLILQAPKANVVLTRDPRGLAGQLDLLARIGDVEVPVSGEATFDRDSETIQSHLRFVDVWPSRLAKVLPQLDDFKSVDLPLTGEIDVALDSAGRIGRAAFELSGGAGTLAIPGVTADTLDVAILQARGAIDENRESLSIDDLFVDFGGPTLTFAGMLRDAPEGASMNGELVLLELPFDELGRYWPVNIAADGRDWITSNVSVGTMRRITAEVDIGPGRLTEQALSQIEPGELSLDFAFENATMNYLDSLPKVAGVNGEGHTNGLTMTVDMRDGVANGIRATHGRAEMRDLTSAKPSMTVLVRLEGDMQKALEMLNAPRLRYADKVGLKPSQVSGSAAADVGVQLLMLKTLKAEDVSINSTATIDALAVDGLFSTFQASDGSLKVTVDSSKGMDANGTLKLEGVPTKIVWRENFRANAAFASQYEVSLNLDEAARRQLGIDLSPYLQGPLPTVVRYTETASARREADAVLDLHGARIDIPELYWSKPENEPADLALDLALPEEGGVVVRNFTLQARDARFEGDAVLDASLSGIERIEIRRMLFGQTEATARIVPPSEQDATLRVSVGGESLDVRPYLRDLMREREGPVPDLVLDVDVKRLITRADQQITDARARVTFHDDGLQTAFLEGVLASGEAVRLRLEPEAQGGRRLVVQSDDAGSVARAFDIYDNAIGGKLYLEASIFDQVEGEPVEGFVRIDDYKVRDAPTLAELLAFASVTGIGDVLAGDGIAFDQFYMPFTIFGDLLTIKDAKTSGSSLGVTASGTVNLSTEETNLRGTIIPVYAVNSAFASIPLLGDILSGGEEGGGIFAATYTVRGPLEAPTLTVNPLAALAPGFLRNLFSIFDSGSGEGGAEEGNGGNAGPPPETDR